MIPGEYILKETPLIANANRATVEVQVLNTGDRPIQIGSHFHFFEVNKDMQFDRMLSFGMRLDIPAGTAVRFEPGEEKQVILVEFGGDKKIFGFNNLVDSNLDESAKAKAMQGLSVNHFKTTKS